MKPNANITHVPDVERPEHKEGANESLDIIRHQGRIVYFSDSALGFDIMTHYPNYYIHALPDDIDGYFLLPPWDGGGNNLM